MFTDERRQGDKEVTSTPQMRLVRLYDRLSPKAKAAVLAKLKGVSSSAADPVKRRS